MKKLLIFFMACSLVANSFASKDATKETQTDPVKKETKKKSKSNRVLNLAISAATGYLAYRVYKNPHANSRTPLDRAISDTIFFLHDQYIKAFNIKRNIIASAFNKPEELVNISKGLAGILGAVSLINGVIGLSRISSED